MKKGISLISLIITIIVIIILAAIVIFTGLSTPDQANFAKFTSEFSDFDTAVQTDYANKYAEHALKNETRSKAQIYYEIANGGNIDMTDEPVVAGLIEDLPVEIRGGLRGVEYYEITDDKNVENWTRDKFYYEPGEKHYITNEGEVFMLPGYLVVEGTTQKWYVNSSKYYIGDAPIHGEETTNVSNVGIKVGDYVTYEPQSATVSTNPENTGVAEQNLSTESLLWRVFYIDDSTGKVLLATDGTTHSSVTLMGVSGYFNGTKELNRICRALYSNPSLGIYARSMDIDDVNKACYYSPSLIVKYAYYPQGHLPQNGTTTTNPLNGEEYVNKEHGEGLQGFLEYDYAENETIISGIKYGVPLENKPVFATSNLGQYKPSDMNNIVGEILKGKDGNESGWLASKWLFSISWETMYDLYIALHNDKIMNAGGIYTSTGDTYALSYSLRPVVELNSRTPIDIDSSTIVENGTSTWKLK